MMYDNIRISDADRERVTARLREHFAEGRLTADELDERITATLNAKTFGDLRPIMSDLPEPAPFGPQPGPFGPQPGGMPPPQYQQPVYPYRRRPRLLPVALLLLFLVLILPGAGWAFFAFVKFALLAWLVLCIVGIFTAARFRRRGRRRSRPGSGDPWDRSTWHR
jgi:Domain of unknown function (DUF1707)